MYLEVSKEIAVAVISEENEVLVDFQNSTNSASGVLPKGAQVVSVPLIETSSFLTESLW